MNAKFTEIHAAADYIGPGAIEVPMYQSGDYGPGAASWDFWAADQAGAGYGASVAVL